MKSSVFRFSPMSFTALIAMSLPSAFSVKAGQYLQLAQLPPEIIPFVESGTLPIALETADLNGDGRPDYLLVLQSFDQDSEVANESVRPLLIVIREVDGTLRLSERNPDVVFCAACGGVMGDPFQGVAASAKSFEVSHYGGSRERWGVDYKFNYSKRDKTWQLVRVKEFSFDALDPGTQKNTTYTPPKDFGKIDFGDFDPDNWKGQGE